MGSAHFFLINDLEAFLVDLEARKYVKNPDCSNGWLVYSKILSNAVIKHYSYPEKRSDSLPISIRVTYELVENGRPLKRLVQQLKIINLKYRKTLPLWKTRPQSRKDVRLRRYLDIQRFIEKHRELIQCFKYQGDDRLTEGNHSFNLEVAATPKEQTICLDFIKTLVESYSPEGIMRLRRQADKPKQQRDGWIKRFALMHKKRGWNVREVAQEIQRELREGTWNRRSRLQYNLAFNTICKIAGFKAASNYN